MVPAQSFGKKGRPMQEREIIETRPMTTGVVQTSAPAATSDRTPLPVGRGQGRKYIMTERTGHPGRK